MVLRRKLPDALRPYKMWGYPYTLWAFIVVSVWFIGNAFVTELQPSLMAFAIIATGVVAYRFWRKPLAVPVAMPAAAMAAEAIEPVEE